MADLESILGDIDVAIGRSRMDAAAALEFLQNLVEEIDARIDGLKSDIDAGRDKE